MLSARFSIVAFRAVIITRVLCFVYNADCHHTLATSLHHYACINFLQYDKNHMHKYGHLLIYLSMYINKHSCVSIVMECCVNVCNNI